MLKKEIKEPLLKYTSGNCQHGAGFILNVDGSSLGNPDPTGFGIVIHDHIGNWIIGASHFVGTRKF